MSRAYDDNQTLQQKIINGANKLADNVASTLGPRGRSVLLQEKGQPPFITKDGATVAAFVACDDPFENASAQIIKQAAVETNNNAGDGTTTATVLARAILRESQRYIASGISPVEIQRGINLATIEVVNNLKEMSIPVTQLEDIEHIASISANNDSSIGKLISLAVDRVGQDGSITIEESRSLETSLDVTEGFRMDAGYCAAAFITDERRAVMRHNDPLILVTDYRISTVEDILPILEMVARDNRPLIIIAEDIEGQALAALIMNALRGTLKVAAIKAPFYGEERRQLLDDVALSTGATLITRESGHKLKETQLKDFGSAKFIESDKHHTTIVGGNSNLDEVEARIETIKAEIEQTDSIPEADSYQTRIVRLSSGVAVIMVGGATEVEMTERKHRIEDALSAVRSAQEEGIVPGGGSALLRASLTMAIVSDNSDQITGAMVVREACTEPIRQMALNAGVSPDLTVAKVLDAEFGHGWDFREGKMTNLLKAGIIDPVKVTRIALQNAASCAGTLITTNFGIIQTEND
jgi:chaperonin GroEL